MRTQQKILDRFNQRKKHDFCGFEIDEYFTYMSFETVKEANLVKDECTEELWNKDYVKPTRKNILKRMKSYINFAYGKARDERGISANRSVMHFIAWIWLMGDDEFCKEIEEEFDKDYKEYGKPILDKINKKYKLGGKY